MSAPAPSRSQSARGIKPEPLQNVQVVVRCRPFAASEKGKEMVIDVNESSKEVTVYHQYASAGRKISKSYMFDRAFGSDCEQRYLYEQAVQPIVEEVLEGFNCTVFAYGQTGTGKTYTMEGVIQSPDDVSFNARALGADAGVIPRAVAQIFDRLETNKIEATVKVSFLELYNEELFDLLGVGEAPKDSKDRLEIRTNAQQIDVVQGAEEVMVKNAAEIFTVLERGSTRRSKAETLLNKQSSRSHSLFILTIHMKETTPEGDEVIKVGKLNLVDLAGSENISRSGAKQERAREAGNINQSLLTLGRVITALVEGNSFVPYRDSKLTRLLKESLGGRAKTCIIATVAPTAPCLEETCSTLEYAYRAKNIKNKPEVNCKVAGKVLIKELNLEVEKLKEMLYLTRAQAGGIFVPNHQYDGMTNQIFQQTEQIAQLEVEIKNREAQVQEVQRMLDQRTQDLDDLKEKHTHTVQRLRSTAERLAEAREGIHQRDFLLTAHAAHESRLAEHADRVTAELSRTAGDLSGAFSKLERKAAVEAENKSIVDALASEAREALTALQSNLTVVRADQKTVSTTVLSLLGSFMERKEREVSAMKSMLGELSGRVEDLAQSATTAFAGHVDTQCGQLESVRAAESAFLGRLSEDIRRAAAASSTVLSELEAALASDRERLASIVQGHAGAARSLTALLEQINGQVESSVAAAIAAAARVKEGTAARLVAQEQQLETVRGELEAQARREQAEMVEQLNAMVSGFVARKLAMVDAAVASMRGSLVEGNTQAAKESDTLSAALQQSQAVFRAGSERAAQQISADAAQMAGEVETVTASLAALSTRSGALASDLEANAGSKAAAIAAQESAAAAAVAAFAVEARTAGEAFATAATERSAAAAAEAAQLQGALASALEGDAAAAAHLVATEETRQASLEQTVGAQVSMASGLAVSVHDHLLERYQEDAPTGATPTRRAVDVPARAVVDQIRTPAHAVLLQSYHKRKADTSLSAMEVECAEDDAELLAPLPPVPSGQGDAGLTPSGRPSTLDLSAPRAPDAILSNGSSDVVGFASPGAGGPLSLEGEISAPTFNSSGGSGVGPLSDLGGSLHEGMVLMDSARGNGNGAPFAAAAQKVQRGSDRMAGSKLKRPATLTSQKSGLTVAENEQQENVPVDAMDTTA